MSVLIKGMEMPEECEVCPMRHFYADTGKTVCMLTYATLAKNYDIRIAFVRHEKCPLAEVEEDNEKKMSVIIKGMENQRDCLICPLQFGGFCYPQNKRVAPTVESALKQGKPKWCPMAELPEKHGRLVDADALIAKYGDWYTEEGTEEGFIGTIEALLKDAPTVVEAEGEDERRCSQ